MRYVVLMLAMLPMLGGAATADEKPPAEDRSKYMSPEEFNDDGLPLQIAKEDVAAAMPRVDKQIKACAKTAGRAGDGWVAFVVSKDGPIALVEVLGTFAGTPAANCITDAAKSIVLGRAKMNSEVFKRPFRLP